MCVTSLQCRLRNRLIPWSKSLRSSKKVFPFEYLALKGVSASGKK
jgi:hypothetical protein